MRLRKDQKEDQKEEEGSTCCYIHTHALQPLNPLTPTPITSHPTPSDYTRPAHTLDNHAHASPHVFTITTTEDNRARRTVWEAGGEEGKVRGEDGREVIVR